MKFITFVYKTHEVKATTYNRCRWLRFDDVCKAVGLETKNVAPELGVGSLAYGGTLINAAGVQTIGDREFTKWAEDVWLSQGSGRPKRYTVPLRIDLPVDLAQSLERRARSLNKPRATYVKEVLSDHLRKVDALAKENGE